MPDLGDTTTRLHASGGSRISRRRVLGTAAWSAPAIVAATAAPAFATSTGTPVLNAVWLNDSFRTHLVANLGTGTPSYSSGAVFAALAFRLTVTGAAASGVQCVATLQNNGVTYNNNSAARGATTWAANNADLAAQGWAASPIVTSTSATTTFTFTRSAQVAVDTPVLLKFVVGDVANADFNNATFVFSATGAANKTVTVSNSSTVSPYISGTPSA